jgi:hypothetical protein
VTAPRDSKHIGRNGRALLFFEHPREIAQLRERILDLFKRSAEELA